MFGVPGTGHKLGVDLDGHRGAGKIEFVQQGSNREPFGYPAGLSGTAIPLAGRIVALADVFDALTSERPYKEAYSPDVARQTIEDESGRHFDPAIVDVFLERFEDFVKVQLAYPNKHVQIFGVTESLLAELCV